MRRKKVAWIFIGMNLALWLGGCAVERRSASIDESQTPLFDEGSATRQPTAAPIPAAPSLRGFDRSHWDTYHYIPSRGLVPHHPHYFTTDFFWTGPLDEDRPSPLRRDGAVELSAQAATGGAREPIGLRRFFNVPLESADFVGDLVMVPVHTAIGPRPWDVVYSPQE